MQRCAVSDEPALGFHLCAAHGARHGARQRRQHAGAASAVARSPQAVMASLKQMSCGMAGAAGGVGQGQGAHAAGGRVCSTPLRWSFQIARSALPAAAAARTCTATTRMAVAASQTYASSSLGWEAAQAAAAASAPARRARRGAAVGGGSASTLAHSPAAPPPAVMVRLQPTGCVWLCLHGAQRDHGAAAGR